MITVTGVEAIIQFENIYLFISIFLYDQYDLVTIKY